MNDNGHNRGARAGARVIGPSRLPEAASNANQANVRLALRRQEAAEALGVGIDYFDAEVRPEIRSVAVGARRVFPIAELEAWLERNAARPLDR